MLALVCLLSSCGGVRDAPSSVVHAVVVRELSTRDVWGWQAGVKQPLGAYKNGVSLHQLTRQLPGRANAAAPDNLAWVDERAGTAGILENPTGAFMDVVEEANPGGAVAFDSQGYVWYVIGGRAHLMAPKLFRSRRPYDPRTFEQKLAGYAVQSWSTTFNLQMADDRLLLFWRRGNSHGLGTTIHLRRYGRLDALGAPDMEADVGGAGKDARGPIGIEQHWTRYDARHHRLLLSWLWYDLKWVRPGGHDYRFGSDPVLYSDDDGATWRSADGAVRTKLPVEYAARDRILVPYDHFAVGEWTGWQNHDLGMSPHGTLWTLEPVGPIRSTGEQALAFFFFDGTDWQRRDMVEAVPRGKAYAGGSTARQLVVLLVPAATPNVIVARVSTDDGRTWGAPETVVTLPVSRAIDWISYAQPADASADDDAVRFFFTHSARAGAGAAPSTRAAVDWVKLTLG